MKDNEERRAFVNGLRQMANFVEANEELPVPMGCSMNVFVTHRRELAALARVGGAKWEKRANGNYFSLVVTFDGKHTYEINIERQQMCRRVVTGKRVVPAEPEHEVEEFAWVCDDEPLLAGDRSLVEA